MFRQIPAKAKSLLQSFLLLIVVFTLSLSSLGIFADSAQAKTKLSGPEQPACADIHVIAARGSGEGKDPKELDMGYPLHKTYDLFQKKVANITIDGQGLEYPARKIDGTAKTFKLIQADVVQGTGQMFTILTVHHKLCPNQKFILMGYSQGAMVVHRLLKSINSSLSQQIKAIVLYGDLRFDPKSKFAQGSKDGAGMLGKEDLAGLVPNGFDYCKKGDFLCNFIPINTAFCRFGANPNCPHNLYKDDTAVQEQAASWLAKLFPRPSNPTPRLVTCSDHMKAPWVALYTGLNYGGQSLCFEGRGRINLRDYSFDTEVSSVNIAANAVFYDWNGNQTSYGYGYETGDVGVNGHRFVSFVIES